MVSVSPQWWQPVGGSRDKTWDLVALVWPIRSRVITTSSALVSCWNFFGGPSVGFTRYRSLPCTATSHLVWINFSECRSWPVVSYLYSEHLPVGLYLGRGSLLLVGPLFHFRQCHSGLVPSRNEHVCPCHSMTRAGQNISGTGESESELGQHSLTNSTHRKVFLLAVSWLWHVLDWRLMSCPLVLPRTSLKHSLSMTWQSVFEDALWTP